MKLKLYFIFFLTLAIGSAFCDEKSDSPKEYIDLIQTKIGNVFIDGQPREIIVKTSFPKISWLVKDFFGRKILEGGTKKINGQASLQVPVNSLGYFELSVFAGDVSKTTPFAVLSPFDIKQFQDSPFGVCTHFAQGWPHAAFSLIAKAGLKTIRDGCYWSRVEQIPGEYEFSRFRYLNKARTWGIKPMICLNFANKLYDGGNAPFTDAGRQAFANYSKAVVKKFGNTLEGVEVWNEYNCGFHTGKTGNSPQSYFSMLKTTYETIKTAQPQTKVVGISMSCLVWKWLEDLFKLGALEYMDAISVHPYRWNKWDTLGPESLDKDMDRLNTLIRKYNRTKKNKPIWCTELSWPSMPKWNVSLEKQAEYLVRTYVVLLAKRVPKIYWYDFLCDNSEGIDGQWGIVYWPAKRGDLLLKPAYVAMAAMTRQLTGWKFVKREPVSPAVWCMKFQKRDDILRVLWATKPSAVTIRTNSKLTITDMMGNEETVEPFLGELHLGLSGSPIYIKGPVDSIKAGAEFRVTTKPQIAVGEPVVFAISANKIPRGMFEIDGNQHVLKGVSGKTTVQLPAGKNYQDRIYPYHLNVEGKTAAMGTLSVSIKDPLELKSTVVTEKNTISFTFANRSTRDEIKLQSVHWEILGRKKDLKPMMPIKATSTRTFHLRIPDLVPFKIIPARITFSFDNGQVLKYSREISYSTCRFLKAGEDIMKTPPIQLETLGRVVMRDYKGKKDLSGRFWLGWDQENFYLTAEIEDNRFCQQHPKTEMWKGDGIQFGIASDSDNCYEFTVAATSNGTQAKCFLSPVALNRDTLIANSRFSAKLKGKAILYQCAIPWQMLKPICPENGKFLFSFLANDNDAAGRKGWIEWAGGIGKSKDVANNYQTFLFERP